MIGIPRFRKAILAVKEKFYSFPSSARDPRNEGQLADKVRRRNVLFNLEICP